MAKLVRPFARRVQPRPFQGAPYQGTDGHCTGEALHRSPGAHEQRAAWACGTAMHQVIDQRLAHLPGQGQPIAGRPLAVDADLGPPPVQILQAQGGDLSSTQAQPGQQQQDRIITPAHCRGAITMDQHLLDLLRWERPRHRAQAPKRNLGHAVAQIGTRNAVHEHKA